MADRARHPPPDLGGPDIAPEALGFFELLRRLETGDRRFGRAGLPADEPARLGQRVRMSVATRDVAAFRPGEGDRPASVDVEVLGLLGPEGALPLHLTRWVMERLSDRWFAGDEARETADTAFLDFCNMLQHRMIALYWRAWGDARPEVQAEQGAAGRAGALLATLAGSGLPGMSRQATASARAGHNTSLAHEVHGPERLTGFAALVLGAPVRLVEFVGEWLVIPRHLQTRVGAAHAALGRGAVAGARVFQRQGRIELRVGPVGLEKYLELVDEPTLRRDLIQALLFAMGHEIDANLRPVLARASIPPPELGKVRLGRTAWLSGGRPRDADDLCLRDIGRAPMERSAA